ncbi:hypothetical protein [Acinetobacter tianfuensis]|nr:hypothetical protein [Acinetobacter tianfuensis]
MNSNIKIEIGDMRMDVEQNRNARLLHAIHKILLKEWDPLGISARPAMRDEYDEYLPKIFMYIQQDASESEIFEYLWRVETVILEKRGNKAHTARIASKLKHISLSDS